MLRKLLGKAGTSILIEIDDGDARPKLGQPPTESAPENSQTTGDDGRLPAQVKKISKLVIH
jgi:hypothetical protein